MAWAMARTRCTRSRPSSIVDGCSRSQWASQSERVIISKEISEEVSKADSEKTEGASRTPPDDRP
jgi:hypothetical protein